MTTVAQNRWAELIIVEPGTEFVSIQSGGGSGSSSGSSSPIQNLTETLTYTGNLNFPDTTSNKTGSYTFTLPQFDAAYEKIAYNAISITLTKIQFTRSISAIGGSIIVDNSGSPNDVTADIILERMITAIAPDLPDLNIVDVTGDTSNYTVYARTIKSFTPGSPTLTRSKIASPTSFTPYEGPDKVTIRLNIFEALNATITGGGGTTSVTRVYPTYTGSASITYTFVVQIPVPENTSEAPSPSGQSGYIYPYLHLHRELFDRAVYDHFQVRQMIWSTGLNIEDYYTFVLDVPDQKLQSVDMTLDIIDCYVNGPTVVAIAKNTIASQQQVLDAINRSPILPQRLY